MAVAWILRAVAIVIVLLVDLPAASSQRLHTDPAGYSGVAGDAEHLLKSLPLAELEAQMKDAALSPARVHIALFHDGKSLGAAWGTASSVAGAIMAAFGESLARQAAAANTAVVSVMLGSYPVSEEDRGEILSSVHMGILGLGIRGKKGRSDILIGPIEMIAANRGLDEALADWATTLNSTPDALVAGDRVFVFDARQYYARLDASKSVELMRGNVLVGPHDVSLASVRELAARLSSWMLNNVRPSGRMVYKYWPAIGEDVNSNNTIRQMMASVCLGRIAGLGSMPGARQTALKNLRYNLRTFYHEEKGGLGGMLYDGSSKLGAAALALLAIVESPARAEYAKQEAGLKRTLEHLWMPDGSFRTFLIPAGRNDNQNFYPGEALLAWATLLDEDDNPALAQKFDKSFNYYRKWHLENRNPAFVPWHTQAYYSAWKRTHRPELRDWIFEMNDWLLQMQSRSMIMYEDTLGRFYDPQRPQFGPPHASSTGVYLEGLIDAFALARSSGDVVRAAAYRRSIVLGLRDAMQLEFADDLDMFYIPDRISVRGGLRTAVYNNEIRVDNVQHVLMALQKILRTFGPEDYRAN
jgi:hypothetical protein